MLKEIKNQNVFTWAGTTYDYVGIYGLIKAIDYQQINNTNFKVLEATSEYDGKKAAVIIFQDSKGAKDYLDDLKFFPKKAKAYKGWDNKLVYCKGFYEQYQDARDEVIKQVEAVHADTIIITGWSLGGGIAPICAEDMHYHFGIKPIVIGYEAPNPCSNRATRKAVYNAIDLKRSVFFINEDDLVPQVPFAPIAWRLNDVTIWLKTKNGKFTAKPHFNLIRCLKSQIIWHTKADETIKKYFEL